MSVFCGIDEAGYGPLLGPLVVTAATFHHPQAQTPADFRQACAAVFTDTLRGAAGRFVVADSKKLHQGANGDARLEAALLPFLALGGEAPTNWRDLLTRHAADGAELLDALADYPWYRDANLPLPRSGDAGSIAARGVQLAEALRGVGLTFCGFRAEVAHVVRFNRDVTRCDNKAAALLDYVLDLARAVMQAHPDEDVAFCIDRQGGRAHYAPALQSLMPDRFIRVVTEGERCSAYAVRYGTRTITFEFRVEADAGQAAVSLASMFCKYVRELDMELFNAFWTGRQPGLTPTAGYFTDGNRFLGEIEPLRAALGIQLDCLRRCR